MVIAFLFLNATIAKEIWRRRRPVDAATSNSRILTIATTNGVSDKMVGASEIAVDNRAFVEEEQSTDKRTTETNTVSNEMNGKHTGQCKYIITTC